MKIENMTSPKSGRPIPNQFIITDESGRFFQSYAKTIVKATPAGIVLDANYWNYSKTTARYRNQFLQEDTKTIKRKLKEGLYKLERLND